MTYKIKVCDRFNTIEWDTENPTTEECQKMYDILANMTIAETQITTKKKTVVTTSSQPEKKQFKPASEAQKLLMRQKKIPYREDISAQQAFLYLQQYNDVIPDKTIK